MLRTRAGSMAKDQSDDAAAGEVHVSDLLDAAAVHLPEDHPDYPPQLRLVLFELFSCLRDAACLRQEGKDRAAAIDSVRAVYAFLARFRSGADDRDLLASFLSLESALIALDQGVVDPLLKHTPSLGRGSNSMDREIAIASAVKAVRHLRWAGMSPGQAHGAVALTFQKAGFKAARGSREVNARTVRHWCAAIAEDVGQHTEAAKFVNDTMVDAPLPQGIPRQVLQSRILRALETFLKSRCSAVLQKDGLAPG